MWHLACCNVGTHHPLHGAVAVTHVRKALPAPKVQQRTAQEVVTYVSALSSFLVMGVVYVLPVFQKIAMSEEYIVF